MLDQDHQSRGKQIRAFVLHTIRRMRLFYRAALFIQQQRPGGFRAVCSKDRCVGAKKQSWQTGATRRWYTGGCPECDGPAASGPSTVSSRAYRSQRSLSHGPEDTRIQTERTAMLS